MTFIQSMLLVAFLIVVIFGFMYLFMTYPFVMGCICAFLLLSFFTFLISIPDSKDV